MASAKFCGVEHRAPPIFGKAAITLSIGPHSSSFFLFLLAYSQPSQVGCLPYFHTWCVLSANLQCRSEMCCSRLAANAGPKNVAKNDHLDSGHHRTTLSGYIFVTTACIDSRKKNLLSSNISPACPSNMVDFGLLAAEIVSLVWGIQLISTGFSSWQRYCTATLRR